MKQEAKIKTVRFLMLFLVRIKECTLGEMHG